MHSSGLGNTAISVSGALAPTFAQLKEVFSSDNKLPHSDHYDESYTNGITDHPRFANLLPFLHESSLPETRLLPVARKY